MSGETAPGRRTEETIETEETKEALVAPQDFADEVRFDPESGLVPAIVQATGSGRVLMLGYMSREALGRTLERGRVTFWSRSREELWEKGESSGNRLEVTDVSTDCDGDTLLVRARPRGPTCHTGRASCFDAGVRARSSATGEEAGDPPSPGASLPRILEELDAVVEARDRERPEGSYTARLLEGGVPETARKVGEEALETVLAATGAPERLAEESADLLYHLLVLWRAAELDAGAVAAALESRRAGSPGPGDPDGAGSGSGG